MDNGKKLAFIQKMTKQTLDHMKDHPDMIESDGQMSHDKKMAFIAAMAKNGLEHFASGGLFGGVSSLLGTNNTYQNQNGPTGEQLNNAATGVNAGLNNQQTFLNEAANQNGFNNQNTVFNQQENLANQLQNTANGQGPNVAQAALNQNTGQNIAQQAALNAGIRGSGSNAGLIARENAQQGAATEQAAVGQGATLEAQQQIAAQQALAAQQAQLQNVAQNQINTQNQATTGLTAAQLQNQQSLIGANEQQNAINAGVAQNNANTNASIVGGLIGGASKVGAAAVGFRGGMSDHLDKVARIHYPEKFSMGGLLNEKQGGKIPGKPQFNHDTIKNDVMPAMLSKGELVVDLDTMNDPGPLGKMARELAKHIEAKKGKKK